MKKTMHTLILMATVNALVLISHTLFASDLDDGIESSAKQSYVFKTYLKGDDVKIHSRDGVVTLTGTVFEESHKSLAREVVVLFPGVKSVDNRVEVKGDASAFYTDAWVLTKVKSALLFHRNVNTARTKVFAKNGTIILRGRATSEAQKELTTEHAKNVKGVKNVINEMTVLSDAIAPSKKAPMGVKMDVMRESIDDSSISALVKTKLMYNRSIDAPNITIETTEGVVNLGGKARSEEEKELVSKLVSDVYGVDRVVNSMTIGGSEVKTNDAVSKAQY